VKFTEFIKDLTLLKNLSALNFQEATAIQTQVFNAAHLESDLLIISPTGTGKTEAYVLPIVMKLITQKPPAAPSVLIITPTRELVLQTTDRIQKLCKETDIKALAIYGGQSYDTTREALATKPAILVASLGRLLDLLDKGWLKVDDIKILVIDEADELLAMGFMQPLQVLLGKLNPTSHKWMISATFNPETQKLASKILKKPLEIKSSLSQNKMEERVLFVDKQDKKQLITYLLQIHQFDQIIVFTRTTHAVDRIVKHLHQQGIRAAGLYGDKKQAERARVLDQLINKDITVLIATDIATRGIDITSLQAIINYEVPDNLETYIHRIGRSARGTSTGRAYTFCDHEDNDKLIQLHRQLNKSIPVEDDHPYMANWQRGLLKSTVKSKKKRK